MRFKIQTAVASLIAWPCVWGPYAAALVVVHGVGTWPADWPGELESYRGQARTFECHTGSQEDIYEISFNDQDDFERAWPAILAVKSPGAPITLQPPMPLISKNPRSGLYTNEAPVVRIFAPSRSRGEIRRPGVVDPWQTGPPWIGLAPASDGQLPEYVQAVRRDGGNAWVGVELGKGEPGFYHRARVDLELVVDGHVIDLNRIPLPADTPIVDKRWGADAKQ